MSPPQEHIRDPSAIYAQSFATIRAEADLAHLGADEARVAVRMIHACGMVEIVSELVFSAEFTDRAQAALKAGAPIFCDSQMLASGITRARLPANNDVACLLRDPRVPDIAKRIGNTRSAAAVDLWGERLQGALCVIGNAPTALFRLIQLIAEGGPVPAAIIGVPVGFVGAAESKEELLEFTGVASLVIRGRKGGSAMGAAAVNALASTAE